MKKRGLAVIYDPHNLLQFVWYYCTYGKDIEWDALCLPNGYKGEYMSEYCEKSGIFERIYKDDTNFIIASTKTQLKLFAMMFGYFIVGQSKKFCQKIVDTYVDTDSYEKIIVLTDSGIVSGACVGISDKKEVIILEDGTGDYVERKNSNIFKHFFSLEEWKSFSLSIMGYATPYHKYPLRTTKNCIKFCSHIDKMPYVKYKKMLQLFDYSKTDMKLFEKINNDLYGEINYQDFINADAVFFTACISDFCYDSSKYIEKGCKYISKNNKSVIIKKHPRDNSIYDFGCSTHVKEFDSSIPAEVLLPYLRGKTIIFFFPSSTLLYLNDNDCKIESVYFKDLYYQSQKEQGASLSPYLNENAWKKMHDSFEIDDIKYVYL